MQRSDAPGVNNNRAHQWASSGAPRDISYGFPALGSTPPAFAHWTGYPMGRMNLMDLNTYYSLAMASRISNAVSPADVRGDGSEVRGIEHRAVAPEAEDDLNGSGGRSQRSVQHSATERRRRNRINEQLRSLRKLVPHTPLSDKACFLGEVVQYLQHLHARLGICVDIDGQSDQVSKGSRQIVDADTCTDADDDVAGRGGHHKMDISLGVEVKEGERAHLEATAALSPTKDTFGPCCEGGISGAESNGTVIRVTGFYRKGILDGMAAALAAQGADVDHAKISICIELPKQIDGQADTTDAPNFRSSEAEENFATPSPSGLARRESSLCVPVRGVLQRGDQGDIASTAEDQPSNKRQKNCCGPS